MLSELQSYYTHNYSVLCDPNQFGYFDSPEFLKLGARCISCVSIPVNLFGVYCIATKTSTSMKEFKWCLLNLQFWTLLIDSLYSLFTTPYYFFPATVRASVGILNDLGVSSRAQLYFGTLCYGGFVCSVVTLFENRHHCILPPSEPFRLGNPHLRRLLFVANFLLGSMYLVPAVLFIEDQDLIKLHFLHSVLPCPPQLFFSPDSFAVRVTSNWITLFAQLCYHAVIAQLVFFICHTIWFLRKQKKSLSGRTLQLQKTFFRGSLVQVAIPILVLFLPGIVMNYLTIAKVYNQTLINLCVLVIPLHGIVATSALIAVNEPYRRFVKSFFRSPFPDGTADMPMITSLTHVSI